ncbi:hypothetical protein F3157_17895 [Virgibacillus dakarensis]|uniref:Uncharacterized protein n=1 Tax=Lentibacillus populi TaxID=1827502 RepID=A0A9W5X4W1_9BACI|nr:MULTISPECIES: hypothetical protein [Bacillaceae]MBT2218406.1 hypothetical protein [Virgibacillus dakarensis]MTW87501.1 hypothetical protein [Virgibacillus dakarensis]GGB35628.1 hypothetical protein GCM10011409_11370 [Lentibacillus populi]
MIDKKKQVKNLVTGGSVKRTIAGGVLGATAGYFANPERAKKLLSRLDKEN